VREQTESQVQENSTPTGTAIEKARGAKYEATAVFENRKAEVVWPVIDSLTAVPGGMAAVANV